ncbi:FAD/NAD(P)-binding domain-containing protein [Cadophora sp. DSE1049]|nr:FAD/NAD(P)-binding domain-containing protein [Cadophora sp. DSE1049]
MARSTTKFKAIIVGGSVAGLTLAHTFERAKIDYVLLEARDTISPSIGASIVIMPNGARILDQLGLYDVMKDMFMTGMRKTYTRRSDGRMLSSNEWPAMVEDRLKYICGICERKIFLRSMYDQLSDRSKVMTGKKVVSIQHGDRSVAVLCQDGSEFVGDIVVGADGIHSFTRQEMQRFAEANGPPGFMDKDKTSITAEYNCFFGISSSNPSLTPGDSHTAADIDHSALLFVSAGSLPQWFFFSKMPRRYIGASNIPRFTKADMDTQVQQYSDFHVTEHVTLKQLVDSSEKFSYFPLEEANHEHWTYGRFVCLGDAIHKMTPNMGQGGNQAIESAAVLTNCLLEMLNSSEGTTVQVKDIEETLFRYQELRQQRAKMIVNFSANLTRSDALATLAHTVRFLFKPTPGEFLADFSTELFRSAPSLNFLPQPARTADNEFWNEDGRDLSRKRIPKGKNMETKARL